MKSKRQDEGLSPEALRALYAVSPADTERVRALGEAVSPRIDELIERFYRWLEEQPEFELLNSPATLARLKVQQRRYWETFFEASVDEAYLASRRTVGEVHARVGLPLSVYFAGMNRMNHIITADMADAIDPAHYALTCQSVTRMLHLDTSIVVETYSRIVNEALAEQGEALAQMSTPVTSIWEGILMLPVVGIIDSQRARGIMQAMLARISATQAKTIILDISGVPVVDTMVANHLIKITKATRLMGCVCTLSGISPPIAETMVELGIEVGDIPTTTSLRDAIADAFERRGWTIHQR